MRELGGILLTGGSSTRMGRDKATLVLNGLPLADRSARMLQSVASIAFEVGAGDSGLPATREDSQGSGPLGAITAGYAALLAAGLSSSAPCLVLACDLPLLSVEVLRRLAEWPTAASVLPVIGGIAQPLCARWSAIDLAGASREFSSGERSLRHRPDRSRAIVADEGCWNGLLLSFSDVDRPEDVERLGLVLPPREQG